MAAEVLDLDVISKDDPCRVVLELLNTEVGLMVVVGSAVDRNSM